MTCGIGIARALPSLCDAVGLLARLQLPSVSGIMEKGYSSSSENFMHMLWYHIHRIVYTWFYFHYCVCLYAPI